VVFGAAALDRRSVWTGRVSDPSTRTGLEWATANGDVWAELWEHTDRGLQGLSSDLLSASLQGSPENGFRAFEVGCGAGSTAIALADARPDASIVACDISPALVRVAQGRTANRPNIEVVLGDAEAVAGKRGPFDLIYSRHGVMFFPDPVQAFRHLRDSASPGASIVFSCFQEWQANPWASELAAAAAGQTVPSPGRAPSGFAFADPDYVTEILTSSGWNDAKPRAVNFNYVAGTVESAMTMMTRIGPAASVLASLPEDQREGARDRMQRMLEEHFDGTAVSFPAAAWIWSARAGSA
jgi:SAM-dependent methyltransferase